MLACAVHRWAALHCCPELSADFDSDADADADPDADVASDLDVDLVRDPDMTTKYVLV